MVKSYTFFFCYELLRFFFLHSSACQTFARELNVRTALWKLEGHLELQHIYRSMEENVNGENIGAGRCGYGGD